MAGTYEDRDRRVIPRWRFFTSPHTHLETQSLGNKHSNLSIDEAHLTRAIENWNEHRTESFAAELLLQANSVGRLHEFNDAADLVMQSANPAMFGIQWLVRKKLVGLELPAASRTEIAMPECADWSDSRQFIAHLKNRLADDPRNAIAWTDLALIYASSGFAKKARRAISTALALAVKNRFVMRSACRFFVHIDEFDYAHYLLSSNPQTKVDPWLLAAEIAAAGTAGRTSKNIKRATSLLSSDRFNLSQTAELACAIATLEAEAGNLRNARKYVRRSLESPTENAVAQAAWLDRKMHLHEVTHSVLSSVAPSAEANAWTAYREHEWSIAVEQSQLWLTDQPFSARPAILGSYIASVVLADYDAAAKIARQGLVANASNFILRNNFVFSKLQQNQLDGVESEFEKISPAALDLGDRVVYLATEGLLYFRRGHAERGLRSYHKAIQLAEEMGDRRRAIMAKLYLAGEKMRTRSQDAVGYGIAVLEETKSAGLPDLEPLSERLRQRIQHANQ